MRCRPVAIPPVVRDVTPDSRESVESRGRFVGHTSVEKLDPHRFREDERRRQMAIPHVVQDVTPDSRTFCPSCPVSCERRAGQGDMI